MSSDGWARYAEYARHLDAVRAEESARTAGMREGVAQMSSQADTLETRLRNQGAGLTALAGTLRLRPPKLTPTPPETPVDPAPGLARLEQALDAADLEATNADQRGVYPALLPGVRGKARAVLFYGVAALVVLVLQYRTFSRGGVGTSPITVLFVIPLIGFALAYLALRLGSRTRVALKSPPELSTRLGFLLCFLIGPIGAAVSVALSLNSR